MSRMPLAEKYPLLSRIDSPADLRQLTPAQLVPLAADHSVGVAILSYDGRLFFGLVADRDVDDLDVLARGLRASLDELAALTRAEVEPEAGYAGR